MSESINNNTGKTVLEGSLQLFLIRAAYVLIEIVTKKASFLVLGEPAFGIIVSIAIGFKIGNKVEGKGWLCGAIPSVVYLVLSLIRALFFPGIGVSVPSTIIYSLIYIISGAVGGIFGERKKKTG